MFCLKKITNWVKCLLLSGNFSCESGLRCAPYGNKLYVIYNGENRMTWFDAKQHCFLLNLTMAVVPKHEVSKVIDVLTPLFGQREDKNAWIGLRLTDYYIKINQGRYK